MGYRVHIDDLIVVLRQNGRMAAEWRNGRMAEWQEWRNGGMAYGMAEWLNGGMVEWQEWRPNGGMTEWRNGGRNGRMAERMAEWLNGGNGYLRTIYGTRQHRRRQRHFNLL